VLNRYSSSGALWKAPMTNTFHCSSFINFKKAFDSIDWKAMFKVLRHYGIPEPLVEAIKALYTCLSR